MGSGPQDFLYASGFSREIEAIGCVCVYRPVRNWFTLLGRRSNSKSAGWAGRLKTQGRANVTVQVQRPFAGRITSAWEEISLFSILAFNWLDEAHPHSRCGLTPITCFIQNPPTEMLISSKNHSHTNIQNNVGPKYLGTMAHPSGYTKLTIMPPSGNGNPFQYFRLGNPMGRGAWQLTVHVVTRADMTEQLSHHYHRPRSPLPSRASSDHHSDKEPAVQFFKWDLFLRKPNLETLCLWQMTA